MKADDKIIERVRKLLAMSKDVNSPHEAAIAAKRARSLMDKYQLTEMDITSVSATEFGTELYNLGPQLPAWKSYLSAACAQYNDVQAFTNWVWDPDNLGKKQRRIKFQGLLVDATCATILFQYLIDTCERLAKPYRGRSNKNAYRLGFASGVAEQVKKFLEERASLKTSDGRALVPLKNAMVERHFKQKTTWKSSHMSHSGDPRLFRKGVQDGKNVSLNRQVNGDERGRLTG